MLVLHRALLRTGVVALVAIILQAIASAPAVAQNFSAFNSPAGRVYLVSHSTNKVTDLGNKWVAGPLVVDRGGVPYIFTIGADLGVWHRTDSADWKILGGGSCTRLKRVWLEAGVPAVQAVCGDGVFENKTLAPWAFVKVANPTSDETPMLQPIFVADRYAIFRRANRSTTVVDLQNLTANDLGGDIITEPIVVTIGGELALFGVAANGSVTYRTMSAPWTTLGGKTDKISSVTSTPEGSDAIIIIPGDEFGKAKKRTLRTDWQEVEPLSVLAEASEFSTSESVAPLEPATSVDAYLDSFIDSWGSDIIVLRSLETAAEFEAKLPTLKTSTLETKLIQAFDTTPIRGIAPKLAMAFPRSKYSEGAAKATMNYLKTLSTRKNDVSASFSAVLRNLPNDTLSDQRSVVLDLFSRIPDIIPTYRGYLLGALKDKTLGLKPDILSAVAKKYYVVMLGHALLGTQPSEQDARSGIAAALSFPIDDDQKKDLQDSLDNYLQFQDAYLVCDATSCRNRPTKGEACSETTPCSLGLQCYGGSCVEFGGKGAQCGLDKPLCHPALSCSGDVSSPNRACVDRAKKMESCRDRDCQFGLACLKAFGICVDTAKEGEQCSGVGMPCIDGRTLTCVEGICKKRGKQGEKCTSGHPCVAELRCSNPAGGTCGPKLDSGKICDPKFDDCQNGLACLVNTAVSPNYFCTKTGQVNDPCGLASPYTVCDPKTGLLCGSHNKCRKPGLVDEWCKFDFECASPLQCNNSKCRLKQNAGGPCQIEKHCVDGLKCLINGTSGTCGVTGRDFSLCQTDAECDTAAGYGCPPPNGLLTGRSCVRLKGEGQPCGGLAGDRCQNGLVCQQAQIWAIGTCKRLGAYEGAPCPCAEGFQSNMFGGQCSCASCATEGALCSGPGVPTRNPCPGLRCIQTGGYGLTATFAATANCGNPSNLPCNGSPNHVCRLGRCNPYRKLFEECSTPDDPDWTPCASGLYCFNYTTKKAVGAWPYQVWVPDGKCLPRIPIGGVCDTKQLCVENSQCVNNRCS